MDFSPIGILVALFVGISIGVAWYAYELGYKDGLKAADDSTPSKLKQGQSIRKEKPARDNCFRFRSIRSG